MYSLNNNEQPLKNYHFYDNFENKFSKLLFVFVGIINKKKQVK